MRRALLLALVIANVAPLGAQTAKRPAITGIAFARFYTTEPDGAQKFYGDTLGYQASGGERRVDLSRKLIPNGSRY